MWCMVMFISLTVHVIKLIATHTPYRIQANWKMILKYFMTIYDYATGHFWWHIHQIESHFIFHPVWCWFVLTNLFSFGWLVEKYSAFQHHWELALYNNIDTHFHYTNIEIKINERNVNLNKMESLSSLYWWALKPIKRFFEDVYHNNNNHSSKEGCLLSLLCK